MQCAFTKEHYNECLEKARDKGYSIKRVFDYFTNKDKDKKTIVLRHDIDFSLDYAYDMASVEYDLGVQSTYYVLLHSSLYNALSEKSMKMLKSMKEMGHEIGLHVDTRYHIHNEEQILERIIENNVITFSQHAPSITPKNSNGSTLALYNALHLNKKLKYISDSGHNWREGCMCNHIGKKDKLYILTHPEWWMSFAESRDGALVNLHYSVQKNGNSAMQEVYKMLEDYKKEVGITD